MLNGDPMRMKAWQLLLAIILVGQSMPAVAKERVVVVLSEASELTLKGGKKFPTGVYVNELMIPAMELIDRGHSLIFVTPNGKAPSFDSASDDPKYFGNDEKKHQRAKKLLLELKLTGPGASALSLGELNKRGLEDIKGVFVPGGHAPVADLAISKELGALLRNAHAKGILTGMICHGPTVMISALPDPQAYVSALSSGNLEQARKLSRNWIYKDYQVTVFSTPEEKIAEEKKLQGLMTYYPEDALGTAGARVTNAPVGKPHVIRHAELLTGQNPASAEEFSRKFADFLGPAGKE
jgi:putative intracellular protease/amidase